MARRRAGTTLAATTGSSPSGRRTPRSCRTGRGSRGQQTRWDRLFFRWLTVSKSHHLPSDWTILQILCTISQALTHDGIILLGEICVLCSFKGILPKVKLHYFFKKFPWTILVLMSLSSLSTDKRHSKEALFTEPGHSNLSCVSWGKEQIGRPLSLPPSDSWLSLLLRSFWHLKLTLGLLTISPSSSRQGRSRWTGTPWSWMSWGRPSLWPRRPSPASPIPWWLTWSTGCRGNRVIVIAVSPKLYLFSCSRS